MDTSQKIVRIALVVAYLALAFISVWATVTSLHLRLPSWPIAFFYVIATVFFFVASWGVKLIVDSFDYNQYQEGRIWKLIGGILILILFWIMFSLPTNTHTFFYRSTIGDVLSEELTYTKGKLEMLRNKNVARKTIDNQKLKFKTEVEGMIANFRAQVMNNTDPGVGPRARASLDQLDIKLGHIERIREPQTKNKNALRRYCNDMENNIKTQLNIKLKEYDERIVKINSGVNRKEISGFIKFITEKQKISNPVVKGEPTAQTENVLVRSFQTIQGFDDELKKAYGKDIPGLSIYSQPKIIRLKSVIDVWKDFLQGKYAGRGFFFWVMMSALVDIAGFIVFYFAFRRID